LRVLDLGCGNGRLALFLNQNPELRDHRPFTYLGLDTSAELVRRAGERTDGVDHTRFEVADLLNRPHQPGGWDLVALFGVLHHLPGFACRRQALKRAARAVAPGGYVALTCWQFPADPAFRKRVLSWSTETIVDESELEPGDYLLRWGPEGDHACRYCHHVDEQELERLVADLPLQEIDRYRADGRGGRQNLYWLGRLLSPR